MISTIIAYKNECLIFFERNTIKLIASGITKLETVLIMYDKFELMLKTPLRKFTTNIDLWK